MTVHSVAYFVLGASVSVNRDAGKGIKWPLALNGTDGE